MKKICEPLLDIETIIPLLNKIAIFGGLTEKELYIVFRKLEKIYYRANECIFRQGEEPAYIYIILKGKVKIFVEAKGSSLELFEFGEGKCFGETAVIGIQSHSANAIAVEDTELAVLSRENLLSFFEYDKELFGKLILNIAREACRRLHKTDEIILHYFLEG